MPSIVVKTPTLNLNSSYLNLILVWALPPPQSGTQCWQYCPARLKLTPKTGLDYPTQPARNFSKASRHSRRLRFGMWAPLRLGTMY